MRKNHKLPPVQVKLTVSPKLGSRRVVLRKLIGGKVNIEGATISCLGLYFMGATVVMSFCYLSHTASFPYKHYELHMTRVGYVDRLLVTHSPKGVFRVIVDSSHATIVKARTTQYIIEVDDKLAREKKFKSELSRHK